MKSILDQPWFSNINRPSRYLGNEVNSVRKDRSLIDVSIALAFPDVYEVGMSHLGLKILYHILNEKDWLVAERVFCPWVDLEKELKKHGIPLAAIESDRPLSEFDIIGFSLQHELSYTNVLTMLNLSGIPFLFSDRSDNDPLIIAGGPACFNPEPVADLFDAIVVGDGERAALEICRTIRDAKYRNISSKEEILSQLRHIKGVYIPSYFRFHFTPDGTIHSRKPLFPGYEAIEKAILPNIDKYPYPDRQVVPFIELVHDRLAVEISRGCTRGCRFCQAGMVYRPVRERAPESILKTVKKALTLTGYEDLSLLSLSSGDYSCIQPLLKALMDRQSREKISISLPSLRVDTLGPALIDQIKRVRKTGFTLAPEAGNNRLRRVINKGLMQEDILEMARMVYGAGWKLIKLYFMIGLPSENDMDLYDIVDLAKTVANLAGKGGKRSKLNVSISTFVPKSHTPFMWMPQISLEESRRRIQLIQKGVRGSSIKIKWNQPEMSWLEGVFARGDRRLGPVLKEAWKMGARYDAWNEHFNMGIWQEAFSRTGIDPLLYHREISPLEILPWDHIKVGVTKHFLKREWQKSLKEQSTGDCREKCLQCGVCDHKLIDPVLFKGWSVPSLGEDVPAAIKPASICRYRLTFTKLNHTRHLSHLEIVRVFIRAFRRIDLDLIYSKGFHPLPKVSFSCALPVGTESLQETLEIDVAKSIRISTLKQLVNSQLPSGIEVTLVEDISHEKKRLQLKESYFILTISGMELSKEPIKKFLNSDHFPVVKVNRKGEYRINARPLVKSMRLVSPDSIELGLKHREGPELKPAEIIKAVFFKSALTHNNIRILKTKQILE